MKTRNSINLSGCRLICFGLRTPHGKKTCSVKKDTTPDCGVACPFYKPDACEDWIRVEDRDGINLIPPEEYAAAGRMQTRQARQSKWVLECRRD